MKRLLDRGSYTDPCPATPVSLWAVGRIAEGFRRRKGAGGLGPIGLGGLVEFEASRTPRTSVEQTVHVPVGRLRTAGLGGIPLRGDMGVSSCGDHCFRHRGRARRVPGALPSGRRSADGVAASPDRRSRARLPPNLPDARDRRSPAGTGRRRGLADRTPRVRDHFAARWASRSGRYHAARSRPAKALRGDRNRPRAGRPGPAWRSACSNGYQAAPVTSDSWMRPTSAAAVAKA